MILSYELDQEMHLYCMECQHVSPKYPLLTCQTSGRLCGISFILLMTYLLFSSFCFLVLFLFFRTMTILMATIPTINTTTRAPTAPRMPPSRRGEEGLVVGVTVVGSVTVLEDTDARMVPPAVVVVGKTASVTKTLK